MMYSGRFGICALAVIGFLFILAGSACSAPGSVDDGRQWYFGGAAYANGGASCIACHGLGAAEFGVAGNASLASDLTYLSHFLSPEGIQTLLENLHHFPTMAAIYRERPLTEDERRHVTAFLAQSAESSPVRGTSSGFVLHGALGAAILFGLFFLLSRRRSAARVQRTMTPISSTAGRKSL
ncbi:hypothetical protein Selin_2444 [Desulfurispirillum indicum S5]|uniref:Cytochrome c domain-containing protein n=1 Tax=Desulfurispirillum indicum (strain ATCC BAA-1389 / DSM 22839 / S5) TaxID=653733 RepID=E6W580_DESIS|nr:hypothetical protein [Desulfurispirillum indicum]ADU67159.1 hypothetical protein Selin_2444 [Desulfurispirillum indicum S5]